MKGELFLNGAPPPAKVLRRLAADGTFKVCADGAFKYCRKFFLPHVVLGDFDSYCQNDADGVCEVIKYGVEKDYTDGHLCLELLLKRGYNIISIYGGDGGNRLDHQFANYSLLKQAYVKGAEAIMYGKNMTVRYFESDFKLTGVINKTISIVPFGGDAHIIYTKGLKYPMCDVTLNSVHILGISNVALSRFIEVGLDSGGVLVFY